jgi:hypothetical protein
MLKATEIQPGDTVFQRVRAEPLQGLPARLRHIRVLANEPGTVTHTPGTVRVRFLSGTDTATGRTVRWTLPLGYWQNGVRPVPPQAAQEPTPEESQEASEFWQTLSAALH